MEQVKRKPMIAWAIKWNSGIILPFSIRHTRKDAILYMESNYRSQWKILKKQGMAAVKVEIKEVVKVERAHKKKDLTQPFPQLQLFGKTRGNGVSL